MCRIKFQGEPLETFFIYEVVYYPENDDLGVVGPSGPARSVTVKYQFFDKLFMSIQVLMADKNEEVIDEKKLTEESVESNLRPLYFRGTLFHS